MEALLLSRCEAVLREAGLELEARQPLSQQRFCELVQNAAGQQTAQLDVSVGGERVTLTPLDKIKAFCMGRPAIEWADGLSVLLKLPVPEHPPLLLPGTQGVRVNMKRETTGADKAGAIQRLLDTRVSKHYRYKQRYTQLEPLVRVDLTAVKSHTGRTADGLLLVQPTYEVEVEAIPGAHTPASLAAAMIAAMRRVGMLPDAAVDCGAYAAYVALVSQATNRRAACCADLIGPKPVTLTCEALPLLSHSDAEGKAYRVTYKADGARSHLYSDAAGALHLLRGGGEAPLLVAGPGQVRPGCVVDGEYIGERKTFLAFDLLFCDGRDYRVKDLDERLRALGALKLTSLAAPTITLACKPYWELAAVRKAAACADYAADGLILMPPSAIPDGPARRGGAWHQLFKWKPAQHCTVDLWLPAGQRRAVLVSVAASRTDMLPPSMVLTKLLAPRHARGPDPSLSSDADGGDLVAVPYGSLEAPHCSSGVVVECRLLRDGGPSSTEHVWRVVRERPDKAGLCGCNKLVTAEAVLQAVRAPVTLDMLAAPLSSLASVPPCVSPGAYYLHSVDRRDSPCPQVQAFHNWVKEHRLLRRAAALAAPGAADRLLDIGCGQGGDLAKWRAARFTTVMGVDASHANIKRLYARLAAILASGAWDSRCSADRPRGRAANPPSPTMIFLPMDATQPLDPRNVQAVCKDTDRDLATLAGLAYGADGASANATLDRALFGVALKPFDVVACMFALHYFCGDESALHALFRNAAAHLRVGGVMLMCCMDGALVAGRLACCRDTGLGRCEWTGRAPDGTIAYSISAAVDSIRALSGKEPPDARSRCHVPLGVRIDVYMHTIGQHVAEFLVPVPRVLEVAQKHGLTLVENSLFADIPSASHQAMSSCEREFSDTHRLMILRKSEVV